MDDRSIVFYANYKSRKAVQIDINGRVSVLFPWYTRYRQIVVSGKADKLLIKESRPILPPGFLEVGEALGYLSKAR